MYRFKVEGHISNFHEMMYFLKLSGEELQDHKINFDTGAVTAYMVVQPERKAIFIEFIDDALPYATLSEPARGTKVKEWI